MRRFQPVRKSEGSFFFICFMRLNRYIAESGVTSRRKADGYIQAGRVRVNGRMVTEPGVQVTDDDAVAVDGKSVSPVKEKIYIDQNKPPGNQSADREHQAPPTVMDLLIDIEGRVFHVGRLDMDTRGLLLLTNDGDVAQKVSHPAHGLEKTYIAVVRGCLSPGKLAALERGIDIGGYVTAPAKVRVLKEGKNDKIEICISEGRNRQVRRMFQAVGTEVLDLQRISIGRIMLGRTREGSYRKLNRKEIDYLKGL